MELTAGAPTAWCPPGSPDRRSPTLPARPARAQTSCSPSATTRPRWITVRPGSLSITAAVTVSPSTRTSSAGSPTARPGPVRHRRQPLRRGIDDAGAADGGHGHAMLDQFVRPEPVGERQLPGAVRMSALPYGGPVVALAVLAQAHADAGGGQLLQRQRRRRCDGGHGNVQCGRLRDEGPPAGRPAGPPARRRARWSPAPACPAPGCAPGSAGR